jgi:hypothetical protein
MLQHEEEEVFEVIMEEVAEEAEVVLVMAMTVAVDHHLKDRPAKSMRRLGIVPGGAGRGSINNSSLKRSRPITW